MNRFGQSSALAKKADRGKLGKPPREFNYPAGGRMKRPESFSDFLSTTNWRNHVQHYQEAQTVLRAEVAENSKREASFRDGLRGKLRTEPNFKKNLKHVTAADIEAARLILAAGDVVAIDGTLAKYELMSGTRSQIGIVAVNYKNDKTTYATYVTEATFVEYSSSEDVVDYLLRRKKTKPVVSNLVLRATMAYYERKFALQQSPKWKIIHGELFPFELRSGLGELHALPESLLLFGEIAAGGTVGSVVSDSSGIDVLLGLALDPNSYLAIRSLADEYDEWLRDEAHFSSDDEKLFRTEFIDRYGEMFWKVCLPCGR